PSDYEGFGLPVVEAQASGCPVVTLRNSALAESGGDAAWFLDAPDPAELARALDVLATDPVLRSEFVARGRAHVARFRRQSFAEGVKGVIREVARAAGRRSSGPRASWARSARTRRARRWRSISAK